MRIEITARTDGRERFEILMGEMIYIISLEKGRQLADSIYELHPTAEAENAALKRGIVKAIAIMDERGRKNQEGNSTMLWNKDWEQLRFRLFALLTAEEQEVSA